MYVGLLTDTSVFVCGDFMCALLISVLSTISIFCFLKLFTLLSINGGGFYCGNRSYLSFTVYLQSTTMFTIPSDIFCWEKQQAQPFLNELIFQMSQKFLMAFCNTTRLYVSTLYVSIIEKNNLKMRCPGIIIITVWWPILCDLFLYLHLFHCS